MAPTPGLFLCVICDELLGDSSCTTLCGHLFHIKCIVEWFSSRSGIPSCPSCGTNVKKLIKLHPWYGGRFKIICKKKLESLHNQLNVGLQCNKIYKKKVDDLTSKLKTTDDSITKYRTAIDELNDVYLNHVNEICDKTFRNAKEDALATCTFQEFYSKSILSAEEFNEFYARTLAEIKNMESEIEELKSEMANFPSRCDDEPSTSSKEC